MPAYSAVGPYKVEGKVDYDAFARAYGLKLIDAQMRKRIAALAGSSHFLIERRIFYAHRDLGWLLDKYENGERFYLYTGRAPSGPMSIAHLLPFVLAKWLQERFDAELYIQIPDEEKYLAKEGIDMGRMHDVALDNVLDIIAMGFKPERTRIFFDTDYAKTLYRHAVRVAKHITFSTVKDALGFGNDANIGKIFYTSMQAVPSFLKSAEQGTNVPCLIPLAVDQDVHFRIARDVVAKLGYYKPALMHCKFMPGLKGEAKMSSSEPSTAIYLGDSEETVKKKVGTALTGQQATAELQRKHGGNPDRCVVCQYYRFLFEPDDKELERIFEAERSGELLAGDHKARLAAAISAYLGRHQRAKKQAASRLERFIASD